MFISIRAVYRSDLVRRPWKEEGAQVVGFLKKPR
jgi:hypothetical protein